MPVEEIKSAPQVLDTDIDNLKFQEDLCLDVCSKYLIKKLFEVKEISALDKKKFFAGALAFYYEAFSCWAQILCINYYFLKQSYHF